MRSRDKLLPEPRLRVNFRRRHAFSCFYDAFSQIDLANKPFIPTLVFHETLLSFRSAVPRYPYTIRLLYIKRRFISKKLKTPPEEAQIGPRHHQRTRLQKYRFKLTTAFLKALDDQKAAVTLHYAHPPAPGNHPCSTLKHHSPPRPPVQ